ncbi:unnamed protein product, partial [marine sediment metagenome]
RQIPVKSSDNIIKNGTGKNGVLDKMKNTFSWLYHRFLSIPIRFDFITLINNLKYYLYDIFPGLIIFSILGYLAIFKEKGGDKLNFAIFSLISSIFWIFKLIPRRLLKPENIKIDGPIPRYFLLIYCTVTLISVFFIFYLSKKFEKIKIIH